MDFGNAIRNWRDTDHQAGPPRFHKKRRTGSGSFRAASGISQVKYNGKRRIQIPGLGSVKLRHTLGKGIVYEAHIKFLNGQRAIGIKMWQPPKPAPQPETRIAHGAVDTGLNPHATDSEGQTWQNPKAYYEAERKLRRWQRAQARRTPGSRGWWKAQRRIRQSQPTHRRSTLQRPASDDLAAGPQVPEARHRRPQRSRHDARQNSKGASRCRHGRNQAANHLQGPVASLRSATRPPLLPLQQDLLQLPDRERETQAGTELAMQQLRHRTRPKHQRSGQPA